MSPLYQGERLPSVPSPPSHWCIPLAARGTKEQRQAQEEDGDSQVSHTPGATPYHDAGHDERSAHGSRCSRYNQVMCRAEK